MSSLAIASPRPAHGLDIARQAIRRGLPLGVVSGLHLALLTWLGSSLAAPDPVTPPTILGVMIPSPAEAVSPPKPRPAEPRRPPPPRPLNRPRPAPLPPIAHAPPTARAIASAPAEAPAAPSNPASAPLAAPAAPSQVAEAAPAPVTPPRTDASHLNNPAPAYPSVSRRLGEQGRVLFDVLILPDGAVGEIRLKRSSGYSRLDEAAREALRRWRYVPARRGNEAIPYWYVQPLAFSLEV